MSSNPALTDIKKLVLLSSQYIPPSSHCALLNYQESAVAALTATLHNGSASLAIIWRRTYQQALQYLLSSGLGNGQQAVQIPDHLLATRRNQDTIILLQALKYFSHCRVSENVRSSHPCLTALIISEGPD